MKTRSRWQDWANVGLGVWLFLSPWLFGYADGVTGWNAWIVGALVFAAGVRALAKPASRGAEAANTALGTWALFSPWFLSFAATASGAAWNAWIVGGVVAIGAAWRLSRVSIGSARHA